jgi:hypothetical protein
MTIYLHRVRDLIATNPVQRGQRVYEDSTGKAAPDGTIFAGIAMKSVLGGQRLPVKVQGPYQLPDGTVLHLGDGTTNPTEETERS